MANEAEGAYRNVYQSAKCPSCGAHLAEHLPGAMTCLECFDCKVYPAQVADEAVKVRGTIRYSTLKRRGGE